MLIAGFIWERVDQGLWENLPSGTHIQPRERSSAISRQRQLLPQWTCQSGANPTAGSPPKV